MLDFNKSNQMQIEKNALGVKNHFPEGFHPTAVASVLLQIGYNNKVGTKYNQSNEFAIIDSNVF